MENSQLSVTLTLVREYSSKIWKASLAYNILLTNQASHMWKLVIFLNFILFHIPCSVCLKSLLYPHLDCESLVNSVTSVYCWWWDFYRTDEDLKEDKEKALTSNCTHTTWNSIGVSYQKLCKCKCCITTTTTVSHKLTSLFHVFFILLLARIKA